MLHTFRLGCVLVLALAAAGPHAFAQSLPVSLFERYLESLRQRAAIPGLSAAIVQDGAIVWERGLGYRDVDARIAAEPDTPYPILGVSQALASTMLLQQCQELRHLDVTDPVRRWISSYPESEATVGHLLAHATPSGGFHYDTDRFAALTGVFEQCASRPYARALTDEILDRLSMIDAVPGRDLVDPASPGRRFFTADQLDRYARTLQRLPVPYHVDASGRPSPSEYPPAGIDASTGVIASARDLAAFDRALRDGILLSSDTRARAWSPAGSMPTGLGWFVQDYTGPHGPERLVWQFGLAPDAFSSLVLKVPGRGLTLILLANSDALTAPYGLSDGDVTKSHFARAFLQLFIG